MSDARDRQRSVGVPGTRQPVRSARVSDQRQRLRDAVIVVATTGLLLLALEGAARLLGVGVPPPLPAKPPGAFRIVAIGGSTVLGVPDGAQGFVAQLERGLRRAAPGRALEMLNLARSGTPSSEAVTRSRTC